MPGPAFHGRLIWVNRGACRRRCGSWRLLRREDLRDNDLDGVFDGTPVGKRTIRLLGDDDLPGPLSHHDGQRSHGIRRNRLERIHRDLADPRLDARSISSIAARWGIPEPTSFSRAFKTLYGTTPRDHRHQTQHHGL
ncbi:helix-turn-helix domain-containing protein [Streptomyces sp. NPDC005474]|uniref:helix-turn-helix domain-containing protein n=1 Tax=Streptomyces sp. NPDC005474 TaxID=3154878 RepID=UPI00345417E2